jgi:hypothetical protein
MPAGRAERRFLLPPRSLVSSRAARRALVALAAATLAAMARRLPGFAGSTAPFLWRNLLDLHATVTADEICIDRPPLDVLLTISGIADARVEFPGRTLHLKRRQR